MWYFIYMQNSLASDICYRLMVAILNPWSYSKKPFLTPLIGCLIWNNLLADFCQATLFIMYDWYLLIYCLSYCNCIYVMTIFAFFNKILWFGPLVLAKCWYLLVMLIWHFLSTYKGYMMSYSCLLFSLSICRFPTPNKRNIQSL